MNRLNLIFDDMMDKDFDKERWTQRKRCPYCESDSYISDYHRHKDGEWVEIVYECESCGKEWVEVFKSTKEIKKV